MCKERNYDFEKLKELCLHDMAVGNWIDVAICNNTFPCHFGKWNGDCLTSIDSIVLKDSHLIPIKVNGTIHGFLCCQSDVNRMGLMVLFFVGIILQKAIELEASALESVEKSIVFSACWLRLES